MSGITNSTAMYCHACHHQWQREADAIECPACRSASTEIVRESLQIPARRQVLTASQITPENDPRHFHNPQAEASENIAPAETQPAPVEPQPAPTPSSPEHEMRDAPTSSPASEPSGNQNQPQNQGQSNAAGTSQRPDVVFMFPPAVTFFTTIVTDTHVPPPNAAGPRGPPVTHFSMNFFSPLVHMHHPHGQPTAPPSTGANTPGQTEGQTQTEDANQGSPRPDASQPQPQPQPQPQRQTASGTPAGVPAQMQFLNALLSSLFNPTGSVPMMPFGDAVFSQEALDRIISQLREQSGPGGAPPASQAAIDRLEVRELDEKMLGGEGKTSRCVICVDEMAKGDKASVLPCNHFFHGECVTPWLKQHNTCPVCRRPVEEEAAKAGKAAEFAPEETSNRAAETTGCS